MTSLATKTEVLIESLPYIQRYEQKIFVVKYGGAAMIDEELRETFAQDVTLLKKIGLKIVIVHGGGREVTEIAEKLGLVSRFVGGLRYTDEAMMDVVQMVLCGKTNKDIVARINQHDGGAIGIGGIDVGLLEVKKYTSDGSDLGLVGEVVQVNTQFLHSMLTGGIMPVIAPIGFDRQWKIYNINADLAAASIATALKAEKLVYLSDVEGVTVQGRLIPSIDNAAATQLIDDGVISDGMIPKIRSAFQAMEAGVGKVHIIDGRVKHALLLEIFTDEGIGTEFVRTQTDVETVSHRKG